MGGAKEFLTEGRWTEKHQVWGASLLVYCDMGVHFCSAVFLITDLLLQLMQDKWKIISSLGFSHVESCCRFVFFFSSKVNIFGCWTVGWTCVVETSLFTDQGI